MTSVEKDPVLKLIKSIWKYYNYNPIITREADEAFDHYRAVLVRQRERTVRWTPEEEMLAAVLGKVSRTESGDADSPATKGE